MIYMKYLFLFLCFVIGSAEAVTISIDQQGNVNVLDNALGTRIVEKEKEKPAPTVKQSFEEDQIYREGKETVESAPPEAEEKKSCTLMTVFIFFGAILFTFFLLSLLS